MGQTNLEFAIDRDKCATWNVSVADVQEALATAVGGKTLTKMVEGEKSFHITLRWPENLRCDQERILDIPVDAVRNRVVPTAGKGAGTIPTLGSSQSLPAVTGSADASLPPTMPRRRLRDLVTPPPGDDGEE